MADQDPEISIEIKHEEEQPETVTKSITSDLAIPLNVVDPTFAAYATRFDITKETSNKLNVIVAHRSTPNKHFVKCGFCGKYDVLGAFNCSKCNTSLMSDKYDKLENDEKTENTTKSYAKTDEFLDCCDKCMNSFVYMCIYSSIFAVLFVFPIFEIVHIVQHWNNYGGCSVYFQYLLLSKLLITLFVYILSGIHIKFKTTKILNKVSILCSGMLLFFAWLIVASILFWGDHNYDHSHCNAHDVHTAGYYDFMYIEIMLVYAIFAFITSYFLWTTIAKNEKLIKAIVYGQAGMVALCLPTAIPVCEIIMLAVFWDNHGQCSDKYEWYLLVKVVFMVLLGIFCGGIFCWSKVSESDSKEKVRAIVINSVIGIVYIFLTVWGFAAAGMFFDKNAYDHDLCNHASMHTAIYYDWMFIEIIMNFALLYLGGNVILCFIFAGYLCRTKKPTVEEMENEIEMETR